MCPPRIERLLIDLSQIIGESPDQIEIPRDRILIKKGNGASLEGIHRAVRLNNPSYLFSGASWRNTAMIKSTRYSSHVKGLYYACISPFDHRLKDSTE
jgi:hypothetical protein